MPRHGQQCEGRPAACSQLSSLERCNAELRDEQLDVWEQQDELRQAVEEQLEQLGAGELQLRQAVEEQLGAAMGQLDDEQLGPIIDPHHMSDEDVMLQLEQLDVELQTDDEQANDEQPDDEQLEQLEQQDAFVSIDELRSCNDEETEHGPPDQWRMRSCYRAVTRDSRWYDASRVHVSSRGAAPRAPVRLDVEQPQQR